MSSAVDSAIACAGTPLPTALVERETDTEAAREVEVERETGPAAVRAPAVPILCLAPMVRVGHLPFRALCLQYGADKVWTEEIVARRIKECTRVENPALGTVDFVCEERNGGGSTVVLRIDPQIESGKVVFQMGVGSAADAVAAALVVHKDVAGIDINMGCPMKFSIQGGMGAALLQKPDVASDIIRSLCDNVDVPVTAKIRLFDTIEATIAFMQTLERAGAAAITVHFRQRQTREREAADWSGMARLVQAVSVPVFANGDFYNPTDICSAVQDGGCAGVLLARPLLLNPSMLRFLDRGAGTAARPAPYVCRFDRFLPLAETMSDYLRFCVKYELPYQV
jgi:tRNA-dihydrouridine synthase 2